MAGEGRRPYDVRGKSGTSHARNLGSSLSPTIQDAVAWTQQAGLQYIWVDALRIGQDDQFEKWREMASMKELLSQRRRRHLSSQCSQRPKQLPAATHER